MRKMTITISISLVLITLFYCYVYDDLISIIKEKTIAVTKEIEVKDGEYSISFITYRDAIGFKESGGKYNKVNSLGYLGKYQFGHKTLTSLGITYNKKDFLNNPDMQEKAFLALLSRNKWLLKEIIKENKGKTINQVMITESGILAAAHLAGVSSVKRYIKTGGKRNFKDAYGTSMNHYLTIFGGYDTSFIVAEKNLELYFIPISWQWIKSYYYY